MKYLDGKRPVDVLHAALLACGGETRPSPVTKQSDSRHPTGRGIAWVNRDDARVAMIGDVAADRDAGKIHVGCVVVAHDCGLVKNPDGLRNQVEGSLVQSISRTRFEEVIVDTAHVTGRDWPRYPILRFEDTPDEIALRLGNNRAAYPSTAGRHPSTGPVAAAIGRPVIDAPGVRRRRIPFRAEG